MSGKGAVTLAYVHGAEVAYSWHRSVTDMLVYDLAHHQRIIRGGFIGVRYSTGGIIAARNDAVRMFLEQRDAEWLLWVDTDMGFRPDALEQLVKVADPVRTPIVGALCFALKENEPDGMGGFRTVVLPTVYDYVQTDDDAGFMARFGYERNAVTRVAGTGSACILIHRKAFERIGDAGWYDPLRIPESGVLLGEDLSFCARAGAAGLPIHVHTGVPTSHLKPLWTAEADFDRWVATDPRYARPDGEAALGDVA